MKRLTRGMELPLLFDSSYGIVLLITVFNALLLLVLPWYVYFGVLSTFVICFFFFLKLEWGGYFLLVVVPILANYIGFFINFPELTYSSVIPLFAPFLFASFFYLGVYKAAKLKIPKSGKNPLTIPIAIFFIYSIFSILWGPRFGWSLMAISLLFINTLLFSFTSKMVFSEESHRRFMWAWIISGIFSATLTVLSIPLTPNIIFNEKFVDLINFFFVYNTKMHDIKSRGFAIGHPNYTALILNISICVSLGFILIEQHLFKKIFLCISTSFMIFANFLTMSKGGGGAFLAMCYFLLSFSSISRRRLFRNMVVFTILCFFLFILALKYIHETKTPRLANIGHEVSIMTRFEIWSAGLRYMKQHFLVFSGLGPGGFEYYTKFSHSHNIYLSFFFDYGLAGVLFLITVILIILKLLWDIRSSIFKQHTYLQTMSLAFCAGWLAIGIHGLVESSYNNHALWLFLALTISTFQLAKTELTTKLINKYVKKPLLK